MSRLLSFGLPITFIVALVYLIGYGGFTVVPTEVKIIAKYTSQQSGTIYHNIDVEVTSPPHTKIDIAVRSDVYESLQIGDVRVFNLSQNRVNESASQNVWCVLSTLLIIMCLAVWLYRWLES